MRHLSIPKNISALLLVVCCFASSSALAHTPQAREADGIIQSIDQHKRILTLTYDSDHVPTKLVWNSDTQFFREGKAVPATELKEGARVTIYYHTPFFGKPFAIKVTWANKS